MTAELPRPGSIWRYRIGIGQARVIYSSEHDIITHNCEVTLSPFESALQNRMVSWRGDIRFFNECFAPGDPTQYPATAH